MAPYRTLLTPPTTLLTHLKTLSSSRYLLLTNTTTNHHVSQLALKTSHTFLRLSLPSIPSSLISDGAYPTRNDITSLRTLARRSGTNSVVGVGGGATIDAAKKTAGSIPGLDNLILIPGTLGGVFASVSPYDFVLCPEEEMVLHSPFDDDDDEGESHGKNNDNGVILLDETAIADPLSRIVGDAAHVATVADASLASLSIATATHASSFSSNGGGVVGDDRKECVTNATTALDYIAANDETNARRYAVRAVTNAARLLGTTTTNSPAEGRCVPVALASGLLVRHFPHGNLLTFWASLLPALCSVDVETNGGSSGGVDSVWADEMLKRWGVPSLSELAEGAPSVDTLVDGVDANRALLKVENEEEEVVEEVLRRSLNR